MAIEQLASSLGRRDEVPNVELAKRIADADDRAAVDELVANLSNKSTAVQNDCIKVLYELGESKPALIAGHVGTFVDLLASRNNRMQWGAMTALDVVASEVPAEVYAALPRIVAAAKSGSVITRDNAVGVLVKLYSAGEHADEVFGMLVDEMAASPTNQLPMYAEKAAPAIASRHRHRFVEALSSRLNDVPQESKRKRIERVIKRLSD